MATWKNGKLYCDCGTEIYFCKTNGGKNVAVDATSLSEMELMDLMNQNKRLYKPDIHIVHYCQEYKKGDQSNVNN